MVGDRNADSFSIYINCYYDWFDLFASITFFRNVSEIFFFNSRAIECIRWFNEQSKSFTCGRATSEASLRRRARLNYRWGSDKNHWPAISETRMIHSTTLSWRVVISAQCAFVVLCAFAAQWAFRTFWNSRVFFFFFRWFASNFIFLSFFIKL